jgi:hypothetical protein
MVVIYTSENRLDAVRQTVAARVRGLFADEELLFPGDNLPEVSPSQQALEANLDVYLRDPRRINGQLRFIFPDKSEALGLEGLSTERMSKLLARHFEAYISRAFGPTAGGVPAGRIPISMSTAAAGTQWVQGGNLFVAIVPKATGPDGDRLDTISSLLQRLTDAIVDWSPSLVDVMLAATARSILRNGFRKFVSEFADDALRGGLVYWFLAGDSAFGEQGGARAAEDAQIRIEQLHREILELLGTASLAEATALTQEVVQWALNGRTPIEVPEGDRLDLSRKWAKTNADLEKMMLAANAFLCSVEFEGEYITTGSVFEREGGEEYWLCVSPACDMVPRRGGTNKWRAELYPVRQMMAIRLKKVSASGLLETAHHGKHIFVKHLGGILTLEVIPEKVPEPALVPLFVEDGAMITGGFFHGHVISRGEGGGVRSERFRYRPIAQLRVEYASRLLQQTGNHLARIGVDFLWKRRPPAGCTSAGSA